MQTIAQYLVMRLQELGVTEIFGVPGDYNFNIIEAIEENLKTNWIGCCNELNAGYAAEGYSRIKGIGALVTTFGVGELSAINAVAGAYSESLPLVKVVGMPKKAILDKGKILHHCLSKDYEAFKDAYSKVTAHSVILSAENTQQEIEEALSVAYNYKKPVYIAINDDICNLPINISCEKFKMFESNSENLKKTVSHIEKVLKKSENTVIISEFLILRHNLKEQMQKFIDKSGFLATTMLMGKGSIDESSKNFIGTYAGHLLSKKTADIVENADCILGFGILMSDFNTGCFTSKLDFSRIIDIQSNYTIIEGVIYRDVLMKDVLIELTKKIENKSLEFIPEIDFGYKDEVITNEDLTQDFIYSFLQTYLEKDDILIAETGLASKGSASIKLPKNATICTQSLWGSIGWATPACLGASLADKGRRPILITGEGSHQMTVQEISTMFRYGAAPIIIVINNEGYTIERLLSKNPMDKFNDIAKWDYTKLVQCFEGEVLTLKATGKREFATMLINARNINKMVYIEAHTHMLDAPAFAKSLACRTTGKLEEVKCR